MSHISPIPPVQQVRTDDRKSAMMNSQKNASRQNSVPRQNSVAKQNSVARQSSQSKEPKKVTIIEADKKSASVVKPTRSDSPLKKMGDTMEEYWNKVNVEQYWSKVSNVFN